MNVPIKKNEPDEMICHLEEKQAIKIIFLSWFDSTPSAQFEYNLI